MEILPAIISKIIKLIYIYRSHGVFFGQEIPEIDISQNTSSVAPYYCSIELDINNI